jgi:hypothetical protein
MSSFFKGFKKGGKNAPAAGSPTSPTALSRKLTRRRTESNTGDGFALAGGGSGDNRGAYLKSFKRPGTNLDTRR